MSQQTDGLQQLLLSMEWFYIVGTPGHQAFRNYIHLCCCVIMQTIRYEIILIPNRLNCDKWIYNVTSCHHLVLVSVCMIFKHVSTIINNRGFLVLSIYLHRMTPGSSPGSPKQKLYWNGYMYINCTWKTRNFTFCDK